MKNLTDTQRLKLKLLRELCEKIKYPKSKEIEEVWNCNRSSAEAMMLKLELNHCIYRNTKKKTITFGE